MPTRPSRASFAVLALLALWVAVYWWTPPPDERAPAMAFDEAVAIPGPRPVVEPKLPAAADQGGSAAGVRAGPLAPPPPVVRDSGVIPPTFKPYVVQPGDSAQSISRKLYGTAEHWRRIAQANPFVDFMHLKPGMEILTPVDPKNVQGVPAKPAAPPRDADGSKEHVVQPGDTLSGIAKKHYGRSGDWPRILDANREVLGDDAGNLRPGMRLRIPAEAAKSPAAESAGRP